MAYAAASFISSVIRRAPESRAPRKIPGKASTLLIWFGKSRAAGRHDLGEAGGHLRVHLGVGVGEGEDDRSGAIRTRSRSGTVPPETPMRTSAPKRASPIAPVTPRRFVSARSSCLCATRSSRSGSEHAARVDDDDVAHPGRDRMRLTATPAAPAPDTTTREVREVLADDPHGAQQGSERHDRRPVLVVVEDRDVETGLEPTLDLEAARSRDVLEVDAAVGRGDPHHGLDDLLDAAGLHADGHGVDVRRSA